MKAASLLGVLVLAKALALAGRPVPVSAWTPFAYLWQDVLLVVLFAGLDVWSATARGAKHRRLANGCGWVLYGLSAAYVALNVPLAKALSTPLTWPLLRAAGGPLRDSILAYATVENMLCMALVLVAAAALPILLGRVSRRRLALAGAVALPPFLVLGPISATRVETLGLHRNALTALVTTALPRLEAGQAAGLWRHSPVNDTRAEEASPDLASLRSIAAGRNVLCIALESTAAQYLHPYGAADDPMPNLTRLAQGPGAVLFENAYAVCPDSIRGLFSVLCSTYPAIDTRAEEYGSIRTPSLAELLGRAGYRTGLFHSGKFRYLGMESVVKNRGFETLEDAGDISGDQQSSFGLDDERLAVRRILGWIDERPRDRRFFATYLPVAGHHPYATPEPGPFGEKEAIDRYRNALHHADVALGELWRGLVERGLERDTLLVIWGDHGEAFGQHPGNFGHTLFVYEENVRVPLLMVVPGAGPAGVRSNAVASLIDVSPTVLDLLGLPAPASYQGESLVSGEPRLALFCTDYSLALLGLRDGGWKFIHEVESGRSKLFDLAADPEEKTNLAEQQPDRVAAYQGHVIAWARAQRGRLK